jgi:hypothetical protein
MDKSTHEIHKNLVLVKFIDSFTELIAEPTRISIFEEALISGSAVTLKTFCEWLIVSCNHLPGFLSDNVHLCANGTG